MHDKPQRSQTEGAQFGLSVMLGIMASMLLGPIINRYSSDWVVGMLVQNYGYEFLDMFRLGWYATVHLTVYFIAQITFYYAIMALVTGALARVYGF